MIDIYGLDEKGFPTRWIIGLDEGRQESHSILPSTDYRNLSIPSVKSNNAIFQHRFDPQTGSVEPLEPLDAQPPAVTGPRHIVDHPTLPVVQGATITALKTWYSGMLSSAARLNDALQPQPMRFF